MPHRQTFTLAEAVKRVLEDSDPSSSDDKNVSDDDFIPVDEFVSESEDNEAEVKEESDDELVVAHAEQMKRCVHKLSKSQKGDLRKSPLKLWTCKGLKFN